MDDRAFKSGIYEQVARLGKATGHPQRIEILELLSQAAMTVEVLARRMDRPVGSVSQHLQHLRQARLVTAHRHGTYVTYRLADETVSTFLVQMRTMAERRYAEMRAVTEAFLADIGSLEAVDMAGLEARVRRGDDVVLIDVRPHDEYAAGHWPGAWSMPLDELTAGDRPLPEGALIAAYCRGPYCVLSMRAAQHLKAAGYNVVRLTEGAGEWRAQGRALDADDADSGSAKMGGSGIH